MTKKPQRKRCKTCATLIPAEQYDDHVFLHEGQLELVPLEHYTKPLEPRRVRRKRVSDLA